MSDDPNRAEIVETELSARDSDWVFWPAPGARVDTGGLCDCGHHEGLGPEWHTRDCPCLVYLWRNRAKELHDRLWDLWEQARRGGPIDCTGEEPPAHEQGERR